MAHTVERIALKSPSPGTERFLTVHRFGTQGARPKAYLQAALHADEWPGLMALNHLIPLLSAADKEGRITGEIIVLPYANPIGLSQRLGGSAPGRYAFDGTGNYNRGWPDLAPLAAAHLPDGLPNEEGAAIDSLRRALRAAVADLRQRTESEHWRATLLSLSIDADFVIDIHCDQESLAHLYCHQSHAAIAEGMAESIDIPVVLLEEEAGGFSFDDCNAGVWRRMGGVPGGDGLPMACFGCTLELRGKDDISDALGASDAAGLMRFFALNGLIDGEPGAPKAPAADPYKLEQVDVVECPVAGLLAYQADVGSMVEEGDVIADVIDLGAEDPLTGRTPLVARTSGLFFARADLRLVEPGDTIGKIAGRKPLAHRKVGALLEA